MNETLPSQSLEAFVIIAKTKTFTKAAQKLYLTQPALSKRIRILEDLLGVTLFIRSRSGVKLTEAGLELLKYCRTKDTLEQELVSKLSSSDPKTLAGQIRIAGPSSLIYPIAYAALNKLLLENPKVDVELYVRETVELLPMLLRNEVDYILADTYFARKDIVSQVIGHETLLAIESKKYSSRSDVYLDAHPSDRFTEEFFSQIGQSIPKIRRNYLPDERGIIEGVERGLGRAIVHKHMIRDEKKVKVIKSIPSLEKPAVLHHMNQPFYGKLHLRVMDEIIMRAKIVLF